MSTIKHPVGPQSEKVYRRRRLVVGIGVVAVLVIIVLIIVRPGSGSATPDGKKAPAAQSTDAPTNGAAVPAGAAGGACNPATIQVDAETDSGDYAAEQLPQLTMSVTNTGPTACTLNAGTSKQVFTITSGDDVWWTSTDCQTDAADAEVTLQPGVAVKSSAPITWDRTRSATDTCAAEERDPAPAEGASYHLSVSVDGISAQTPTQFLLN